MADSKYDDCVACWDYNVLGEKCPFASGGECHILGWGNQVQIPIPEDHICDKRPGPISQRTIILFDLEEGYAQELKKLHASDGYKRWQEAYYHYQMPEGERRKAELEMLYRKLQLRMAAYLSRREFKKQFKPKELGVRPNEPQSFRMRVLEALRPTRMSLNSLGSAKGSERVAFKVNHMNDRYLDGSDEIHEEWLEIEFLTRGTNLESEVDSAGYEEIPDLKVIAEKYIGEKILVEAEWWWSGGTYFEPYESDFGINDVKLLKVLT